MKRPILLINDNPDLLCRLSACLDQAGFDVSVAPDGAAGMAVLYQHAPCWVLLDLSMPVMDGYEFLNALRTVPFPPRVFVVTDDDCSEARQRSQHLGAEQFFTEEQALHPQFAPSLREALGLPPQDRLPPVAAAA
ncbi:MAG TPA: response regulator [Terriglobales bacterium]|nr:response regulator [Terriglobales bacterium]